MRLRVLKSRVTAASQPVLLPLDHEFRGWERIVEANMVNVEMGTDDEIDVVWTETEIPELVDDILAILQRRSIRRRIVRGEAAIDQDVLAIMRLHQITTGRHLEGRRPSDSPRCNLKQVEA